MCYLVLNIGTGVLHMQYKMLNNNCAIINLKVLILEC